MNTHARVAAAKRKATISARDAGDPVPAGLVFGERDRDRHAPASITVR